MKVIFYVGLVLAAPGLYAQSGPALAPISPPIALAPLSLAECRALALEHNQRLAAAGRRQRAAEAGHEATKTNRLPKLDFSGTGYYVHGLGNTLNTQGVTAGVGLTQTLYSGGRLRAQTALADVTAQVATAAVQATRQQQLTETDQTYWQTVALRDHVMLAERNRTQLQALVRDVDNKYRAGLAYQADLLRAQVQLRDAEVRLLRTRDDALLIQLVLRQLIGRPAGDSLRLADSVEGEFATVSPADYAARARAQRPDLRRLALANQADSLQLEVARSARWPQINASVNALYLRQKPGFLLPEANNTPAYALVSVNLPLVHWQENRLLESQRRYLTQASRADLAEAHQQVTLEVSRALLRLNQAARRIELQRLTLTQAQENLRLNDNRFRAGLLPLVDLLEAQTLSQRAATELLDAKVEYRVAEAALAQATGEQF
ncbi:TolC family protein [Hymenobacter tibetensis]|uniref:TolC family protein n=1 Tax=Hymenobacter tibetensis TaxID=497967 RepID=A0ABY4CVZ8_9BACT|nr:TolC family protein [Hymenobacter tibetensis]UOG73350.1 TolC family protein [Hymenobacter tibetensis]